MEHTRTFEVGAESLREPIAQSWRRAKLAGLDPGSALDGVTHEEVDRAGPLLTAALPVLEDLNERLENARYSTVLVDREGRIAHRWCGDAGTRRAFDHLGLDVGASLLEEAVGTNALGTVLETRSSITINGEEHFAVPLRRFSCHGHPILHPTTRRIEGVLDLSALADEASPLLAPLVARAVADIEQRLLDGSRVSEKQLFAAFQAAGRRKAVVAIGQDLLLSNQAAQDLIGPTDLVVLRMMAGELGDRETVDLRLESGAGVRIRAVRVGRQRGGALLELEQREMPDTLDTARPPRQSSAPILICGPPGSGRTTEARRHATELPATVLTAASALLEGSETWAKNFAALTRAAQGTVVIDGVDLLPDPLLELVTAHTAERRAPRVILVTGPADMLTGRAAALAGECIERIALPALAQRPQELGDLAARMLHSLEPGTSLHLTPAALRALSSQPWPGNLRELRAVLEHVTRRRSTGGIAIDDLPEAYRSSAPARPMAPIERAERDAIIAALREHNGNKVRAAEALGISRTTLYAKMRALSITVY